MIERPTAGRKRLTSANIVVMLLMLLFCQITAQPGAAQSVGGFEGAIYDIVPDAATLSSLPATGMTLANSPVSPAVFGTIGAPFTGPGEVMPITGGAGTFRGISGEANIRPYCQSQAKTTRPLRYDRAFCFGVIETPRRRSR